MQGDKRARQAAGKTARKKRGGVMERARVGRSALMTVEGRSRMRQEGCKAPPLPRSTLSHLSPCGALPYARHGLLSEVLWGPPEDQPAAAQGQWRLGHWGSAPGPPCLSLARLAGSGCRPEAHICLATRDGRGIQYESRPERAWECGSRPAPTGSLGGCVDCPAHARRQSMGLTDSR